MPRKGYKPTEEHKRKVSKAKMGHVVSEETRRKIGQALKGFKHSEEFKKEISRRNKDLKRSEKTKRKISEFRKGMKFSKKTRIKISEARKGMKFSEEHRKNLSESHKGHEVTEKTKRKLSKATILAIKEGRMNPETYYITGDFYSKKNKKELHYRSQLELNWYELLEQMNKVKKYQVEPCIIPYEFEGIQRSYLPDLRIVYTDGTSELIEIKPEGDYFRNDPQNKAKWKAARKWCKTRKRKITFDVVGYEELN